MKPGWIEFWRRFSLIMLAMEVVLFGIATADENLPKMVLDGLLLVWWEALLGYWTAKRREYEAANLPS